MSVMTISDVSVSYGKKKVLDSVSFDMRKGEVLGVLGLNGSGKSTLIRAMCNILPHTGSVSIDGETAEKLSAKRLAGKVSYVPQKSELAMDMPVIDVVNMGFNPHLTIFGAPDSAMTDKSKAMLIDAGFADRMYDNYMTLSEGQKQICILLRALITDGKAVLMDEPESALDINVRHRMMNMIRRWTKEKEKSVLVALHDTDLALNFCDRILLLANGKVMGEINPDTDSLNDMEERLSRLYGSIAIKKVEDRRGRMHLVMIKEDDE